MSLLWDGGGSNGNVLFFSPPVSPLGYLDSLVLVLFFVAKLPGFLTDAYSLGRTQPQEQQHNDEDQ